MEPTRVRVLRGTVLGKKVLSLGARVPLSFVIENIAELLAIRAIVVEEPEHPSPFCVLTRQVPEGDAFQVVELESIPSFYVKRGWAIPLDDAELSNLYHCGACKNTYFTYSALQKHKEATGHKRPYRKKETLDEGEGSN